MAESALSGVFREYTLTYETETGDWTVDAHGNPVPETASAELVVNFEPYQFAMLRFMEGADPKVVRGKGTCINPSVLPSEVGVGKEFDMTFEGMPGKIKFVQITPAALEVLDTVLGQDFIAEWRSV